MTQSFLSPAREGSRKKSPMDPGDVYGRGTDVSQSATVIAVDPGGTTGWALACFDPKAFLEDGPKLLSSVRFWTCGQVDGSEDSQVETLVSLLAAWPQADVVVEDFLLREFRMGRELLAPVRVTAKLEYAMRGTGEAGSWNGSGPGRRFYLQQPALAKSAVTDHRLKLSGFYEPTIGKVHARDAVRHLLTFARRKKTGTLFS